MKRLLTSVIEERNVQTSEWHIGQDWEGIPAEERFARASGIRVPPGSNETFMQCYGGVLSCFLFLFDHAIDLLVFGTNQYAQLKIAARKVKLFLSWCVTQRRKRRPKPFLMPIFRNFKEVSKKDIMTFFGIIIMASICGRLHQPYSDWFCADEALCWPWVKKYMSGRRFTSIFRYLHCASPWDQVRRGVTGFDPLYKVRELFNVVKQQISKCFIPFQMLSLDEMMVSSKARLSFLVTNLLKPIRKGIKIFALVCVKTRWVVNFEVYTGETGAQAEASNCPDLSHYKKLIAYDPKSKVLQLIGRLMFSIFNLHYIVYTDRWFTGLSMVRGLLSLKTYVCGTVHLDRGFPNCIAFTKEEARTLDRGQSLHAMSSDGKVLAVSWKDSKPVYLLSSVASHQPPDTVTRRLKSQLLTVRRHPVIVSYNGGMGGVDDVDAGRSYYPIHFRRIKRWWLNILFWLLEVVLNNSLILYNAMAELYQWKPKTTKEYRRILAELLVGDGDEANVNIAAAAPVRSKSSCSASTKTSSTTSSETVCDQTSTSPWDAIFNEHMPARSPKKRCVVCGHGTQDVRTRTRCRTCDVALCPPQIGRSCFADWHIDHVPLEKRPKGC